MTYEFQSTLFRTSRDVADAIAEEWITAGGSNGPGFIADYLSAHTSEYVASEAIDGWDLNATVKTGHFDEDGNETTETWLESRELTAEDIAAAVDRFRNRPMANS